MSRRVNPRILEAAITPSSARMNETEDAGRYGATPLPMWCQVDKATEMSPIARAGPSASASCSDAETSPWCACSVTASDKSEEVEWASPIPSPMNAHPTSVTNGGMEATGSVNATAAPASTVIAPTNGVRNRWFHW